MKLYKRVLSLIMAFLLCVSMMPVSVMAEAEHEHLHGAESVLLPVEKIPEIPVEEPIVEPVEEPVEDPVEEPAEEPVEESEEEAVEEAAAAEEEPVMDGVVTSGTCGDSAKWKFADGVLTIYGTGDMNYGTSLADLPWYDLREEITSVVVEKDITSVANAALYEAVNVTSVTLPEGLVKIGASAFYGINSIKTVSLPEGLLSIGNCAFQNCSGIQEITVPGSVTSIGASAFSDMSFGCPFSFLEKLDLLNPVQNSTN